MSKGNIKFLLSFQVAVPQSYPSHPTDSGATRRRIREDNEIIPSSHTTIPNGDCVVSTENVDVKPDPFVLSAQLSTANSLGKRGPKRKIVPNDDEEDSEVQGPPDVTKSKNVQTKLPTREIPHVVKCEPPEVESSSEENQEPIRYLFSSTSFCFLFICNYFVYFKQRKRIHVSKGNCHTLSGDGSPSHGIQGHGNRSPPYIQKRKNGMKIFECKTCKKTFNQLGNLKTHLRTHTGERPYFCYVCSKSFAQQSSLNTHLKIHTGEKPHQCKICTKRFTQMSGLQIHERLHTREKKQYHCDVCNKLFYSISGLKVHKRLHDRIYECDGCQKKFIGTKGIRSHWETSKCEPSNIEESSLNNSDGSDVEGDN